jgi:hypothetical protein
MHKINFQPVSVVSTTPVVLLNGAFTSLAGPVGFTPSQPRIVVKRISVLSNGNSYAVFKNGAQVFAGPLVSGVEGSPGPIQQLEQDIVLDASDSLSATSEVGATINIEAEIGFTE